MTPIEKLIPEINVQRGIKGFISRPLKDRIEERYIPEPNSGCWIWLGATTPYGHAVIGNGKSKNLIVHRVLYEFHRGDVLKGLELDHLCRVPSCINPFHLEAVTHRENVKRGLVSALKDKCKQGHLFTKENTYWGRDRKTGYPYRRCKKCTLDRNFRRWHERTDIKHRKTSSANRKGPVGPS